MRSNGWENNEAANHLTIDVADTLSVSTAPFGFVKSRVVTDSRTGHVVETFLSGPTTRPEQVHRNFKNPRDVHVIIEVYEKKGKASETWDEQDMIPEDQTRYRALAARLNFLAVDRPDHCTRQSSAHGEGSDLRIKTGRRSGVYAHTLSPA